MRRSIVAWLMLGFGVGLAIAGCSAQFRPRTNVADDLSWVVWGAGMSLIAAAVMLYLTRRERLSAVLVAAIALVAFVTPFAAFVLLVAAYWGYIVLRALLQIL